MLFIAFIFISTLFIGCVNTKSGNEGSQLKRDKDTEFDEGSKIIESTFSKEATKDLAKLSKVWGVVKYHHPKVISGDINIDYELFV